MVPGNEPVYEENKTYKMLEKIQQWRFKLSEGDHLHCLSSILRNLFHNKTTVY